MRIIAGAWRGRRLRAPKGRDVRPTTDRVREAWMSALGGNLNGFRVLDLFAGSGALGLEALSRGASEAVFVELSRRCLDAMRANIELLGCEERARVVCNDARKYLEAVPPRAFDVAFADPPYSQGHAAAIISDFVRCPFAEELWVEHRSDEAIPELAGMEHRRYGDTTLTTLMAPAAELTP